MATITYAVKRTGRSFKNGARAVAVMEDTLSNIVAPHFINSFEAITANWSNKPHWARKMTRTSDALVERVWPTASRATKIYEYVTKGTQPHLIPKQPKTVGALAFWGGTYIPKTVPGGSWGGPGVSAGGTLVFAKQVHHPGTKARKFEEEIIKRESAWFFSTMENAWRRAIRAMKS